ncbi:MAG: response regulator transcription factor [Kangiellaceae bacterium]|nr:response regulator transcription factor [Kangiellaceae bacterium]
MSQFGHSMLNKHKILIVEDEADIAELIKVSLVALSLETEHCADGDKAIQEILKGDYSLVILDLMLPGTSGLDICKAVRAEQPEQAIMMLTAKGSETDQIVGLELGADDYMTKPFSIPSFQARVRVQLRRVELLAKKEEFPSSHKTIQVGRLSIDQLNHTMTIDDNLIELTSLEFDLLTFFMERPDQVFSRANLLDKVWGYDHDGYEHTVNSNINRLRRKLSLQEPPQQIIQTVWGVGYKLSSEDCQ